MDWESSDPVGVQEATAAHRPLVPDHHLQSPPPVSIRHCRLASSVTTDRMRPGGESMTTCLLFASLTSLAL